MLQGTDLVQGSTSQGGGTSRHGTHRALLAHITHRRSSGPSLTGGCVVRPAPAVLRPPPTPTRLAIHFPRSSVIGHHAPVTLPQVTGPGRASPVPAVTIRTFRAPYAGESLAAALQDLHRFHGLHPEARGSALPLSCLPAGILTTRQASLHATDHPVAPPQGLLTLGSGTGRFPPIPPACYGASWQLPRPDLHRQATTSATSDQPTT